MLTAYALTLRTAFQVATVLWVVLGVWALGKHLRQQRRGQLLALGAVFLVALAVRLAQPPSPHDLNARSDGLLLGSVGWTNQTYGIARVASWRLLLGTDLWGPIELETLTHATAVSGALLAVVVMVWMRLLRVSTWGALATGLLLALDPLLVLFGHTDAPQLHELLPFWTGLAAFTAHTRWPDPRYAALGAAATIVGVCQRPEGVLLLPLAGLLALSQPDKLTWRRDTVVALVCVAVVPLAHLALLRWSSPGTDVGRMGWGTFGPATYGLRHWLAFSPRHEGWPFALLALSTLWAAPFSTQGRVGWVVFVLGLGLVIPEAAWSPEAIDSPLLTRHHLRMLPAAAASVGFAVHHLASQRDVAWLGPLLVVGVLGLRLADRPHLGVRYSLVEEYTFQRTHFGDLPRTCQVVTFRTPYDLGLMPSQHTGPGPRLPDFRWLEPDGSVPGEPTDCLIWYRPAMCAAPDFGDACTAFEAAHTLEPIAETHVASRGWLYTYAPDEESLRIGLYRVSR